MGEGRGADEATAVGVGRMRAQWWGWVDEGTAVGVGWMRAQRGDEGNAARGGVSGRGWRGDRQRGSVNEHGVWGSGHKLRPPAVPAAGRRGGGGIQPPQGGRGLPSPTSQWVLETRPPAHLLSA